MKESDVYKLKSGEKIEHKHLGTCTIDSIIPEFGACIVPDSEESRNHLSKQSGMPPETPFLETEAKLLSVF